MAYWQAISFDSQVTARLATLRKAQEAPGSGLWLAACPGSDPSVTFSPEEWQLLLRARIGAPCFLPGSKCQGCGSSLGVFGDHALCCSSNGLYRRHNHIQDTVYALASQAHWKPQLEAPIPLSLERPADILLHSAEARPLAIDVTVCHPLRLSASAAVRDGRALAAEEAEKAKMASRSRLCEGQGWSFRPFAMDTTGAFGPHAARVCRALSQQLAMRRGTDVATCATSVLLSLSLALAKGKGEMLVNATRFL